MNGVMLKDIPGATEAITFNGHFVKIALDPVKLANLLQEQDFYFGDILKGKQIDVIASEKCMDIADKIIANLKDLLRVDK